MAALPLMAERVDPETARKVAATFLNNNGAKASQLTDLSKAAGFPNLYIFNANPGFVVMAADDCVQPILGYSFENPFVAEGIPENVRGWLLGYSEEIQYAIDNQMRASSETVRLWKDLTEGNDKVGRATTVVTPLIQTNWDQTAYYNLYCPAVSDGPSGRAYTGCVATAMAQVMKYWNYPSTGIGSHSYTWNGQTLSADFGNTTYQWNNMTNTYNSSSTTTAKQAVSTLMYHCGVALDMSYGGYSTGGSSASTAHVVYALNNYFNYSSNMEYKTKSDYNNTTWESMVKAELDAGRPLQYRGRSDGGGHSFVCDGYDSNNKFHFNWGWSGAYDGYFSLDNLNTGANNQSGQGNGTYTDDQAAIFGIQPAQPTAAVPTNLSYSLTGIQNLTLQWNSANGAISYNIYRNNNYVANTTDNSYSETAPFGTNIYFVRSVDANGELSLASNSVSVLVAYQIPMVNDLQANLSETNVNLSWTAPKWCYPETESAKLNYGEGSIYYSWTSVYYAHRHLAADLATYAGKAIYKVSTFIEYPGNYSVYIYTKSNQYNKPDPNSLAFSEIGTPVSVTNGWYEFIMNEPIILTGNDDLWIVIKQENTGQTYAAPSFNLSEHNTNAFYAGSSPTNLSDANSNFNCAWLINTYLTDGTYTYNLYDGTTKLNGNTPISSTSYTVENIANNTAHQYAVTTNYYGGETGASNMVGITLGTIAVDNLALDVDDIMTVTSGSTLSVSNTLSNTNPANLIIEDGAQLIHHNDGVKATVKRGIEGYGSTEGGWYTIATPFANFNPAEIATDDYDLYYYDEDAEAEWINYKAHPENFPQALTGGYLYARQLTSPVDMTGTLNSGVYTKTVNLSYGNSNASIKGYNLLGNPTAHEITFAKSANVSDGYYYLNNSSNWVYQNNNIVPAGRGFLVKANAAGQTVTLNPQSKHDEAKAASLLINVDGEIAYVKLNEGVSMPLLSFKGKRSNVYLSRNGEHYIMLVKGESEAIDLCYHPSQGTHTLSVKIEEVELDYLHLIDHLTGAEIDLLQNPSYNFESSSSDYPTRFQLVFSEEAGNNTGDDFEFIDGKSQILDMTGRVVATDRNTRLAPGVYILQTINEKETTSQKIIIK